jgi:hypothetical protein
LNKQLEDALNDRGRVQPYPEVLLSVLYIWFSGIKSATVGDAGQ